MADLSVPWWELVLRAIAVYGFVILLLRISGKRQVGQLSLLDLVLLLVLSNAVQNAMNAGDNSLLGGLLSAAVLVGLNWLLNFIMYRNKRFADLVEGRAQLLVHNGEVYEEALAAAQITRHELNAALRAGGYLSVEDVHAAILEVNGNISVTPRVGRETPATSASQPDAGDGGQAEQRHAQ